jgi:hypothetical protein
MWIQVFFKAKKGITDCIKNYVRKPIGEVF